MRWIFGSWFFYQLLIVFAVRVRSLLAKIPSFFSKLTHFAPNAPLLKNCKVFILKICFYCQKKLKILFSKNFLFFYLLDFLHTVLPFPLVNPFVPSAPFL